MFKEIYDKDEHLSKCPYVELQCIKCQDVFKRKDQHDRFDCMEKQICLLRENMLGFEEKSSKIIQLQRKQIDMVNEKLIVIEDIWGNDDDDDHDEKIDQKNEYYSSLDSIIQSSIYWEKKYYHWN